MLLEIYDCFIPADVFHRAGGQIPVDLKTALFVNNFDYSYHFLLAEGKFYFVTDFRSYRFPLMASTTSKACSYDTPSRFAIRELLVPLRNSLSLIMVFVSSVIFCTISIIASLLRTRNYNTLTSSSIPHFSSFSLFFNYCL